METKSTAQKLLISSRSRVWSSRAEHLGLVGPLPDTAQVVERLEDATWAIVFAEDAASLREIIGTEADHLAAPEALWLAYPKGNRSDINRDSLWPILADYRMRPVAQVSLDDRWSAMRFREFKAGEQFTGRTR